METTILSSTVVATVIAGVLSFISARKQESLQYITAERKQWRDEIRKYVDKLQQAKGESLGSVLNALKVRINPWGKNSDKLRFNEDSHIWELIEEMQEKKNTREILQIRKQLLVDYLSLLLKQDWESAKAEVRIGWNGITVVCLLIGSLGCYTYIFFQGCALHNEILLKEKFFLGLLFIMVLVLHYLFAIGMMADLIEAKFPSAKKREKQKDKADIIWENIIVGIIYMVIVGLILSGTISIFKIDTSNAVDVDCAWILFMFLNLIIIRLKFKEYKKKISDNSKYFKSVLKCQENAMQKIVKCICQENKAADVSYCKNYFHDSVVDGEIQAILDDVKVKKSQQDNRSL